MRDANNNFNIKREENEFQKKKNMSFNLVQSFMEILIQCTLNDKPRSDKE